MKKKFNSTLSDTISEPELFAKFADASESIAEHYEKREFSKAIREIMALADLANQYIDEKKPWQAIKEEGREQAQSDEDAAHPRQPEGHQAPDPHQGQDVRPSFAGDGHPFLLR